MYLCFLSICDTHAKKIEAIYIVQLPIKVGKFIYKVITKHINNICIYTTRDDWIKDVVIHAIIYEKIKTT